MKTASKPKRGKLYKLMNIFFLAVLTANLSLSGVFFVAPKAAAAAVIMPDCEIGPVAILNGGFETPLVTDGKGWQLFSYPDTGWQVEWIAPRPDAPSPALLELHKSGQVQGNPGWTAYERGQYAELDADYGFDNGEPASVRITQSVSTFVGATYSLSYAFSPRPGVQDNLLTVKINGETKKNHQTDGTGLTATVWATDSVNFTADGDSALIEFADASNPDSLGTFLDDVKLELTACPAPTGDLTICKQDGSENPLAWGFQVTYPDQGVLNTGTNAETGCVTISDLAAGDYIINENAVLDWEFVSVDCIGADDDVWSQHAGGASVRLGAGGEVVCTFVNRQIEDECEYTIEGYKRNSYTEGAVSGVEIVLEDDALNVLATTTTNDNGWYQFTGLCVGDYIIREVLPFGWAQDNPIGETEKDYHEAVLPYELMQIAMVSQDYQPQTPSYDFWNRPLICGTKYDYDTNDPIGGWGISLSVTTGVVENGNGAMSTIMLLDSAETDENGTYCFDLSDYDVSYDNLFVVSEEERAGWQAHGETSVTEHFDRSAPLIVDFYNSQENGQIPGCTDSSAINYNQSASQDDGSCQYRSSGGGGTPLCILLGTCGQSSGYLAPEPDIQVLGEEGAATLKIVKTSAKTEINPGEKDILFTVKVTNTGNLTAFNVVLTDVLPAGMVFADSVGQTKEWLLGNINPGETKEVNYKANIDGKAGAGSYKNIAKAKADNAAEVSADTVLEIKTVKVLAATGFVPAQMAIIFILGIGLILCGLILKRRWAYKM